MTGRLKAMDKENEIESDWKFAAMVIDRLDRIDRFIATGGWLQTK